MTIRVFLAGAKTLRTWNCGLSLSEGAHASARLSRARACAAVIPRAALGVPKSMRKCRSLFACAVPTLLGLGVVPRRRHRDAARRAAARPARGAVQDARVALAGRARAALARAVRPGEFATETEFEPAGHVMPCALRCGGGDRRAARRRPRRRRRRGRARGGRARRRRGARRARERHGVLGRRRHARALRGLRALGPLADRARARRTPRRCAAQRAPPAPVRRGGPLRDAARRLRPHLLRRARPQRQRGRTACADHAHAARRGREEGPPHDRALPARL